MTPEELNQLAQEAKESLLNNAAFITNRLRASMEEEVEQRAYTKRSPASSTNPKMKVLLESPEVAIAAREATLQVTDLVARSTVLEKKLRTVTLQQEAVLAEANHVADILGKSSVEKLRSVSRKETTPEIYKKNIGSTRSPITATMPLARGSKGRDPFGASSSPSSARRPTDNSRK